MRGSKPLTEIEVKLILSELTSIRNQCLFIVGLKTGYRIGELLSLTFQDVTQYGKIKDSITVTRANMKGKISSRTVVLHDEAKAILNQYLATKTLESCDKIFPISRIQASRIIKKAVERAKVEGKVSTHSMRKSFCHKVYHALKKDLVATQRAMGHASVNSTVSYLSFDQEEIDNAIKGG